MPKFWIDDISELYRNYKIIPNSNYNYVDNYNIISKILILLTLIVCVFSVTIALVPLVSLLIVIASFYLFAQKNNMDSNNIKQELDTISDTSTESSNESKQKNSKNKEESKKRKENKKESKKSTDSKTKYSSKSSFGISFFDNSTNDDQVSLLSNISLQEEDADYNRLFKDTNTLFDEEIGARNSASMITYDLGNTVGFAETLLPVQPTCKESNFDCFNKYENLKRKR